MGSHCTCHPLTSMTMQNTSNVELMESVFGGYEDESEGDRNAAKAKTGGRKPSDVRKPVSCQNTMLTARSNPLQVGIFGRIFQ